MSIVAEQPVMAAPMSERSTIARWRGRIPLPRGPQWYLVLYRWLLVVASLYTVAVTWNVWQDRSDPNWHPWRFATAGQYVDLGEPSDRFANCADAAGVGRDAANGFRMVAGCGAAVDFDFSTGGTGGAERAVSGERVFRSDTIATALCAGVFDAGDVAGGEHAIIGAVEFNRAVVLGGLSQIDYRFDQAGGDGWFSVGSDSERSGEIFSGVAVFVEHAQIWVWRLAG